MSTQRFVKRREVCQALGISRQRLHVLIAEGRIEETPRGIDLDKAIAAYRGSIDPAKRAAWEGATVVAPTDGSKRRRGSSEGALATDPETGQTIDFAEARTRKEIANAQRAHLEFAIKSGAYLPRDEVVAKEFAIGRNVRDRLIGFPSRLSGLLPPEAMKIMVEECEALARELQDAAATIAEDAGS